MTLIRKKLSKAALILLAIVVVGIIALPILHFTNVLNLAFLGDYATSAAQVATTSGWIAAMMAGACGAVGFGICYVLKDYIIGMEDKNNNLIVSNSGNTGSYNPLPTQPSQGVGVS
jgi:hypothetical protein